MASINLDDDNLNGNEKTAFNISNQQPQQEAATRIQSKVRQRQAVHKTNHLRCLDQPDVGANKHEAATKIQSKIRQHQTKQKTKNFCTQKAEDHEGHVSKDESLAATKIQSKVRQQQARQRMELMKGHKIHVSEAEVSLTKNDNSENHRTKDENLAAIRIQSKVRQQQAKQRMELLKGHKAHVSEAEVSLTNDGDSENHRTKDENLAAIRIQSKVRQQQAKQRMEILKPQIDNISEANSLLATEEDPGNHPNKNENFAAIRIQSKVRQQQAKQRTELLKQQRGDSSEVNALLATEVDSVNHPNEDEIFAAIRIQSKVRQRQVKQRIDLLKKPEFQMFEAEDPMLIEEDPENHSNEDETLAAVKIQSKVRQRQALEQVNAMRGAGQKYQVGKPEDADDSLREAGKSTIDEESTENEEEKNHIQKESATKIQSLVRQRQARSLVKSKKSRSERSNSAATQIQSQVRRRQAQKQVSVLREEGKIQGSQLQEDKHVAATKIQSKVRQRQSAKQVANLKDRWHGNLQENTDKKHIAATKIQSKIRQSQAQKKVTTLKTNRKIGQKQISLSEDSQDVAATRIQSKIRQRQAVVKTKKLKESGVLLKDQNLNSVKERLEAASIIQVEGKQAQELPPMDKSGGEDNAAVRIQSKVRQRQACKRVEAMKTTEWSNESQVSLPLKNSEAAATKIQAKVRQRQAQKRIGEMKEAKNKGKSQEEGDQTSDSEKKSLNDKAATRIQAKVRQRQAKAKVQQMHGLKEQKRKFKGGRLGNSLEAARQMDDQAASLLLASTRELRQKLQEKGKEKQFVSRLKGPNTLQPPNRPAPRKLNPTLKAQNDKAALARDRSLQMLHQKISEREQINSSLSPLQKRKTRIQVGSHLKSKEDIELPALRALKPKGPPPNMATTSPKAAKLKRPGGELGPLKAPVGAKGRPYPYAQSEHGTAATSPGKARLKDLSEADRARELTRRLARERRMREKRQQRRQEKELKEIQAQVDLDTELRIQQAQEEAEAHAANKKRELKERMDAIQQRKQEREEKFRKEKTEREHRKKERKKPLWKRMEENAKMKEEQDNLKKQKQAMMDRHRGYDISNDAHKINQQGLTPRDQPSPHRSPRNGQIKRIGALKSPAQTPIDSHRSPAGDYMSPSVKYKSKQYKRAMKEMHTKKDGEAKAKKERDNRLQKQHKYGDLVREMYQPEASPAKQLELEELKKKIHTEPRQRSSNPQGSKPTPQQLRAPKSPSSVAASHVRRRKQPKPREKMPPPEDPLHALIAAAEAPSPHNNDSGAESPGSYFGSPRATRKHAEEDSFSSGKRGKSIKKHQPDYYSEENENELHRESSTQSIELDGESNLVAWQPSRGNGYRGTNPRNLDQEAQLSQMYMGAISEKIDALAAGQQAH